MQALDSGETGHSTSYAEGPGRKPLNRFGNIVVCKSVVVSCVVSTASSQLANQDQVVWWSGCQVLSIPSRELTAWRSQSEHTL